MLPHRAPGISEWFDECENDVNNLLCHHILDRIEAVLAACDGPTP